MKSRPYSPHWLHRIYEWVDQLPVSPLLFYLLVWSLIVLVAHLSAWNSETIAFGRFDLELISTPAWLLEALFFGNLFTASARRAFDEFAVLLDANDAERGNLRFNFVHIPWRGGNVASLLGLAIGSYLGYSEFQTNAEGVFTLGVAVQIFFTWGLSNAFMTPLMFQVIRQMRQISRYFRQLRRVDLYNLQPVYAFSKFTVTVALAIFFMGFVTSMIFDPGSFRSPSVLIFSIILALTSLLVFYLPLSGANQRLKHEKAERLVEVDRDLETAFVEHRKHFRQNPSGDFSALQATVGTLEKERTILASIPTWPWSPGTLRSLLSAVLLPLALWFVQELLGRLFDF